MKLAILVAACFALVSAQRGRQLLRWQASIPASENGPAAQEPDQVYIDQEYYDAVTSNPITGRYGLWPILVTNILTARNYPDCQW